MLKTLLAKAVFIIHLLSIGLILFGWLLPLSWLTLHMIFVVATVVQWWVNNDQCILTQLQHWLEGKKVNQGEQGQFVKSLFANIGLELNPKQLFYIVYGLMLISFSLSLRRFISGI